MNQASTKGGKTIHIVLTIIAIVVLVAVGFYIAGFRVGKFGIAKAQTVSIIELPEETEVFLDNKSIGFKEGNVELALAPGLHSIILSKVGFWPYIENIELTKGIPVRTTIKPFFFLQNPSGVLIGSNDPEYNVIISLFNKKLSPSETSPVTSSDGSMQIYVKDERITAKWLGDAEDKPTYFSTDGNISSVFNPVTEVRSLAFYKDRNDVMIVAMQDGIFALEINPNGTQNLQPLFEGKEPDFRIGTDGKLYAKDENTLMLLSI